MRHRGLAARVSQTARIAEANPRQAAEQATIATQQEIAVSQRTLALKEGEIKAETDAAGVQASATGPWDRPRGSGQASGRRFHQGRRVHRWHD